MSNEPNDTDAVDRCLRCGGPTKRVSFRTGSVQMPKRQEQQCGACGQHTAVEEPPPEATEPAENS